MKNKMKILSYHKKWINDLCTVPFKDLKKTKYSMSTVVTFRNDGHFGQKVTKSTVCTIENRSKHEINTTKVCT